MENFANVIYHYNKTISSLSQLREEKGQGAVRDAIGTLFHEIAVMIVKMVDDDLDCKKNDYMVKYSSSGKYKISNLQVDVHVYKNGKLVLIVESKTYLDACYLKRAVEDFTQIRDVVGNVPAVIWSGQNAVGKNTFGYYNEEYEFETFFVNQTKKRNSNNPVYKSCDPLDVNELKRFYDYVKSIVQ